MSALRQIRASAGSGKTWELTRQYAARLAALPNVPDKAARASLAAGLLAVTFTNAAADEMRERVIVRLKECALGNGDAILDKVAAGQWLDVFLSDLSALNIRTIDSLLHQIIRASALDLNIPPDYEVEFDVKKALAPLAEQFLADAEISLKERELLREACAAFMDGQKLEKFSGGQNVLANINELMELALTEQLEGLADEPALRQKLDEARQAMRAAAQAILDHAAGFEKLWKPSCLKAMKQCADSGIVSGYIDKDNIAALFGKGKIPPDGLEALYQSFREAIVLARSLTVLTEKALRWLPAAILARRLAAANGSELAGGAPLPNILAPIKALSALDPPYAVSDALCRLGNRLMHFLVDEFQDTSAEQWGVLRPLVLDALARGGSMLWVGDPKQSIYGWRGGRPELFDDAAKNSEMLAIAGNAAQDVLPRNWRSRRNIVEFNNRIFAPLADANTAYMALRSMLAKSAPDDVALRAALRLATAYADVRQTPSGGEGGLVAVEQLENQEDVENDEIILERISRLLQDELAPRLKGNWSDVLILTRGNGFARIIAERLGELDIPVLTENGLLLNENALIQETVAFLTFLADPEDDIAFWTFMNGQIMGEHPDADQFTAEDLTDLAVQRDNAPLCDVFRKNYPQIWSRLLAPFFNHASVPTAYDTVREWHARMDVAARFHDHSTMLRRFYETLHLAENDGRASIMAFLDWWNENSGKEKAPAPENMNAVRIMTIHKAKGLQAPVTIIPDTAYRVKATDKPQLLDADGLDIVARLTSDMGASYYEDCCRQAHEGINLLYVAMTRAVDELYIFFSPPKNGSIKYTSSALSLLMDKAGVDLPYRAGAAPSYKNTARQSQTQFAQFAPARQPESHYEDWRPMKWLPRLKIFRHPVGRMELAANERGTLLHAALANLLPGALNRAALETALLAAERETDILTPEDMRADMLACLAWFAALPETRQWLASGYGERSFTTSQGRLLRPDLIVPRPRGPLVIDYKSGQPEPAHARQMRMYLQCIDDCGEFAGHAEGLLIYLDLRRFMLMEASGNSDLLLNPPRTLP